MSKSNDELSLPEFNATLLEAPAPPDSPITGSVGTLFGEADGHGLAKLAIVEGLPGLVTRELSYQEFVIEILISVLKVVKSEAGSILEVNHDANHLFFRAVAGTASDRLAQYTIPMGKGIVGHVAETRLPMSVHSIKDNPIYLNRIGDESYSAADVALLSYATDMIAKAIEARLMISSASQQPMKKAA